MGLPLSFTVNSRDSVPRGISWSGDDGHRSVAERYLLTVGSHDVVFSFPSGYPLTDFSMESQSGAAQSRCGAEAVCISLAPPT